MLKKKIIYHFFIPKDYETNIAVKLHRECLKMYCNNFDSAVFYISTDEDTEKYVQDVRDFLFNLREWPDIRIRVIRNDIFCEARTFKEEILDKLDDFNEEVIFFGHTKGVTNVVKYANNAESIMKWIYACYFYSLETEYANEAVKELIYGYRAFYGSVLMASPDSNGAFYAGTFYWMNPMRFKIINKDVDFYNRLSNRSLAEEYPSYFWFKDGDGYLFSHYNKYLYNRDLYTGNFDDVVRFFGDYDMFMEKYNEIKEKL